MSASGRETVVVLTGDESFARTLQKHLIDSCHAAVIVRDEAEMLAVARQELPALILVDRRAGIGQTEWLRRHRQLVKVPIITVQPTGIASCEEECQADLEQGADDAICNQPYRVIIAKVRAVLRRRHLLSMRASHYTVGKLHVDLDRYEVQVGGKPVELTPKEFKIVEHLVKHPAKVFTRNELVNLVWGDGCAMEDHTLDVHIHSIRRKIETDPAHPRFIMTVRGVGYKLKSD